MALYETYMGAIKDCLNAIENHQIFAIELVAGDNQPHNAGAADPENGE